MKFVCDRCQTRYTIADEKIRQRIVRFRCKNCGGVVTLHGGDVVPGPQDASARPSGNLPAVPVEGRASSRVSRPPVPRTEWFVAVDGVEEGPLSCAEAAKYIVTLGPDHVVHVWKEGMDEWKRPKDVAIIAQELSALKRSPGEAPARTTASADATVVTPPPVAFNSSPKPAPPSVTGSGPKLPGMSAKPSSTGSAPKGALALSPNLWAKPTVSSSASKPVPVVSGSGPKHASPHVSGSGPKSAPVSGSGPKATPPPIPAGHRAPPSVPGVGPVPTPKVPTAAVPDARPAAKSSTHPVVKTPAPVTVPRPTPVAAAAAVPDARPAAKSSTHPVVKTPPPATIHQPEAETAHTPATEEGAAERTPGAKSEFDDDVPTSPDARRRAVRVANVASGPESTPPLENTPGVQDFSQSDKTPPPSQPLPPVGATVPSARQSKSWQVSNLSFAHPPAVPEGMSAEGTMALPTPAPLGGPLFGNVADMPVRSLVGHAEVGLSKLTGLAGLVHKHRHLKYVAAAGVLVVLIIAVILLSWQGENAKGVAKVAEIEKKARAAALAAEPVSVPAEEPTVAPVPEREASRTHGPAPTHASRRAPRPSSPSPSGKAARTVDPFAPPAGMTRSAEKPIPLAAIQGKRATAGSEPRAISQSQISDVVRKRDHQAGLKTCYERALKRDGRLRTGRLDITVSIGPMGKVQRVQVHGSADFMVIDKCLKEAIRHWRFPANSEEYATSFPLILQGG